MPDVNARADRDRKRRWIIADVPHGIALRPAEATCIDTEFMLLITREVDLKDLVMASLQLSARFVGGKK